MTEKYAVGAQVPGLISFKGPITDVSTFTPTVHFLNVPEGMINIGGLGKGYVIDANVAFPFVPNLSNNTYVLYATVQAGATGKAVINYSSYSNYISGGDDDNQRAFCYFKVANGTIDPTSIFTFDSGTTVRDTTTTHFPGLEDPILRMLKDKGFYFDAATDFGYTRRGQYLDEGVTFESGVQQWDVVYKHTDGAYHPALADDTNREKLIGVADINRDGITGKNYVLATGFITIGETAPSGISQQNELTDALFPAGTDLYLSGTIPGLIVRDMDAWEAATSYAIGARIEGDGFIWESEDTTATDASEPDWPAESSGGAPIEIGDTVTETSTKVWTAVAVHTSDFLTTTASGNTARKIRIGVSLGNGEIVLGEGGFDIDDHDDSAYAHLDIQDAMNKHGIYVNNTSQGRTTFEYRGQGLDDNATFVGVGDGENTLVYKHSGGSYQKAFADGSASQDLIGMSRSVATNAGFVVMSGFVSADTSLFAVGDSLYLVDSTISGALPGEFTNTPTAVFIGNVILVGVDTGDETGGVLCLDIRLKENLDLDALLKGTTGLTGYDVIVGSSAEVSGQSATHTMTDWLDSGAVADGDRVYILSDVLLPTDQEISGNDVKIYFDPDASIAQESAGYTLTFSGDRIEIFGGRFTGFEATAGENLLVTGTSCDFRIVEGALGIFDVSGAGSIVRSTNSGLKTPTWVIDSSTGDMTLDGDITGTSGNLTVSSLTGNTFIEGVTFNGTVVTGLSSVTSTVFVGNVTGDLTGNADSVTVAVSGGDSSSHVAIFDSTTGSLVPKTDPGLTYDATTNILTSLGGFVGALSGNADQVVTAVDGGAATHYVGFFDANDSSAQVPKTDAGLTYNPSTNVLTVAGSISGILSTAAQGNITSLGTLTTLTVDNITINGNTINASGNTIIEGVTFNGTIVTGVTSLTASGGALTGTWSGNHTYSGVSTHSGNIVMNDNVKIGLGTSSGEATLYSNGTDAYLDLTNTTDFYLRGGAALDAMISAIDDGGVFLYYNGSEKLETTTNGVEITGNATVSGTLSVEGLMLASSWPSFNVNRPTVQNLPHGATTKIEFGTELFDTNTDFDNTTNYRFTPTVAGKYSLTANVGVDFLQTYTEARYALHIYKNGSSVATSTIYYNPFDIAGFGQPVNIPITTIQDANGSTDYFEVFVFQSNSGTADEDSTGGASSAYFCGSRIG